MKNYFVILNCQKLGKLTPLLEEDGELAQFETKADADRAARTNMLAELFGWEVFVVGNGE